MPSIHDVTTFIYRLEQELSVLTTQYEGSYVYSFLRTRIVTELQKQLGLVKQPHDIPKRRTRTQRYVDFLIYDLRFLLHNKKYDTLVIEHERQVEVDGTYIDIYTDELVKQRRQMERVMCIRRFPKRDNKTSKNKHIFVRQGFLDRFDYVYQQKKRLKPQLPIFDTMSQRLNDEFGTNLDINGMLQNLWPDFIRQKRRFIRWLKKYQPKEVIVVVGYYSYEFIEACKENNIKVSEVQHGIVDINHSGYAYPYQKGQPDKVPYFVDQLYSFNTYWSDVCPLPLRDDQITQLGFLHFRKQQNRYHNKKQDYQVLVISQGTIGQQLVNLTIDIAIKNPDYIFIYKLHPGEYLYVNERYPQLKQCPSNMLVVKNEVELYQWMSIARYMIGAYSTAIYEGLAFGCKVMLMNTDGVYDYMKYLIDHQMVHLLSSSDDFLRLKDQPVQSIQDNIF